MQLRSESLVLEISFVFKFHLSSSGKRTNASRVDCLLTWLYWQLPAVGTFRTHVQSTRVSVPVS
jgi:hypothetical protein